MTVDELLRRLQCNESQEDWAEFVRRTHPFIMSTCLATCKYAPSDRNGIIEEAVQRTYMKVLGCLRKSGFQYEPHKAKWQPFLWIIAQRETHSLMRIARRHHDNEISIAEPETAIGPQAHYDPIYQCMMQEICIYLYGNFAKQEVEALIMYLQNYTLRDIAAQLGFKHPQRVQDVITRILAALGRRFGQGNEA